MISEQNYSFLDRLTHRLAYLSPAVQLSAADMESTLFGAAFREIPIERPVFIASLPRAGTTLLLEIAAREAAFACQRYRDMPFVLAPLLWNRVSSGFHRTARGSERAHGDGMTVDYDSPEAFEEVVWKAFWPRHFRGDVIPLWTAANRNSEFEAFLRRHMQKVISLRSREGRTSRYLSKNNANIARIGLLRTLFRDASILVPVRDPVQHASSMHRQHLRFMEIHERERFTARYMKDIGHFEFGRLHKPLSFPGVERLRARFKPTSLDYWIGYWICAFNEVLRAEGDLILISYEGLLANRQRGIQRLAEALGLADQVGLAGSGQMLREPTIHEVALDGCDATQVEEARALHRSLLGVTTLR